MSGAVQLTPKPVVESAVAVTLGAAGAGGGSSASVRSMVTATVALSVPSSTLIVTA